MKLSRARKFALEILEGTYENQYGKIEKYVAEIRRVNPRSNVLCMLDQGKFGGQLLVTVGMDTNDCIFPIAFGVVEVESTDSWMWFVNLVTKQGLINAIRELFPEFEHMFYVRHMHNNLKNEGHRAKA
ncbi:hypothetical protein PTKIN_Ptkin02bG0171600 [Pterospermum kingtungense]